VHLVEIEHPVARDLLTRMRGRNTPPQVFRELAGAVAALVAVEATRNLHTVPTKVETPLEETLGEICTTPPVIVVILRAGLGMLDAFQKLLPGSPVGFVAVRRDEETAAPVWYYDSVPEVEGRSVIILDPMLATGGTSGEVVEFLRGRGAGHLTLASMVAAPEGVAGLRRFEDLLVITASVDRDLDQRKFIRPGLGDFGDRLFSGRD
jgi:uracil phosphoribosyltransferase